MAREPRDLKRYIDALFTPQNQGNIMASQQRPQPSLVLRANRRHRRACSSGRDWLPQRFAPESLPRHKAARPAIDQCNRFVGTARVAGYDLLRSPWRSAGCWPTQFVLCTGVMTIETAFAGDLLPKLRRSRQRSRSNRRTWSYARRPADAA